MEKTTTGPAMSYNDNPPTLQKLLDSANLIEASLDTAIANNDDSKAEALSAQFEEIVRAILSFSTTSFTDLKQKCAFGQKLIVPDHNDPVLVSDVFAKLITDIEKLNEIYNT